MSSIASHRCFDFARFEVIPPTLNNGSVAGLDRSSFVRHHPAKLASRRMVKRLPLPQVDLRR